MPTAISFDSVGLYNKKFRFIKSPDLLSTWSCKVMKNILAAEKAYGH